MSQIMPQIMAQIMAQKTPARGYIPAGRSLCNKRFDYIVIMQNFSTKRRAIMVTIMSFFVYFPVQRVITV